jgi:hypothetical protein
MSFLSFNQMLQLFRSGQPPCSQKGAAQRRLSDSLQAHVRAASAPPRAGTWIENAWLSLDEHFLLKRCEFDHAPVFVGVTQGGEDFSGDSKVRVVHVGALLGFGEAQREAAKFVRSHNIVPTV